VIKEINYECPSCKRKNVFKKNIEIHETDEDAEKVKDLSLFDEVCSNCGYEFVLIYGLYYISDEHKFATFLTTEKDHAILFAETMAKYKNKGYKIRVCTNHIDFSDKVRVLSDDLNDVAMEFLKVNCYNSVPEEYMSNKILFTGIDDKRIHLMIYSQNPMNFAAGIETYLEYKDKYPNEIDDYIVNIETVLEWYNKKEEEKRVSKK
jgi:predicted nucleic-acid-binding Zn-ribbon protein